MSEEKIKEAFLKAKQDISLIQAELESIKQEIQGLKHILQLSSTPTDRQTGTPAHLSTQNPTHNNIIPTIQHIIPTSSTSPAHIPAHNLPLKPLKSQNNEISTGNEGVPTDRQTDRQTDNSTRNEGVKVRLIEENLINNQSNTLPKVSEVLDSLDTIKRDLKQKFKKLTNQELVVFLSIYKLEEESFLVDYALLSQKLSLTESSVRDYVQRLIKKGLPITKTKENNKKIILSISSDFKKITSFEALSQLKESRIR